jgi:hypothetical protein
MKRTVQAPGRDRPLSAQERTAVCRALAEFYVGARLSPAEIQAELDRAYRSRESVERFRARMQARARGEAEPQSA